VAVTSVLTCCVLLHHRHSAEKRALDRLGSDLYETLREAAEVHRTVRKYAQSIIRPGIVLADMCEKIENMNRALVKEDGLNVGVGVYRGLECGVFSAATRSYARLCERTCALSLLWTRNVVDGHTPHTAWHRVPYRLLFKPRRRALHAQRGRQHCVELW
jgi:hypothetical protein